MECEIDEKIKEFANRFSLLVKNYGATWNEYKKLYDEIKRFENNGLSDEQIKKILCIEKGIYGCNISKLKKDENMNGEYVVCLKKLIKLENKNLSNLYLKLIDGLMYTDLNEALKLCNKIILNSKFRRQNELDVILDKIISSKIKCSKEIVRKLKNNDGNNIYNLDIIKAYDELIKMNIQSANNMEYYYIDKKLEYLTGDIDSVINPSEFNLRYCLRECEHLLANSKCERKLIIYKYKLKALLNLRKYDEVIYCYEMEVENLDGYSESYEVSENECFQCYVAALYNLNKYDDLLEKMNSPLMDKSMKILFYIQIGKFNNRKNMFDKALELINKESSLNYDGYKIECLKELKKVSTDNKKKETLENKIQDLYYKILDGDDKLENNNQAYSIFVQELLENKDEGNDVLYHYTNIDALKGIIENRELWITKSDFLNDFAETKYIQKIFANVIKNVNDEQNTEFKNILSSVKFGIDYYFDENVNGEGIDCCNEIKKYITSNLKCRIKDSYIMSLSTNKDSITLWGNYSNNDGYNIGFKKDNLINYFRKSHSENFSNVIYGKVIYKDNASKNEDIGEDEVYKLILRYYHDCKNRGIGDEKIICGIIGNLIFIGQFIKLKAFEHEDEYRIVFLREKDIGKEDMGKLFEKNFKTSFKIKEGSFIPYIKLPASCDESIAEINIGPNNKSDIAEEGLKQILQSNGYDAKKIKINHSGITLRY